MKLAISKKNLWENTPFAVKSILSPIFRTIPPSIWLGRSFRKNIAFVEKSQWWKTEEIQEYQIEMLKKICSLAYYKTRFYKSHFAKVAMTPLDIKSISDFKRLPFIDKLNVLDKINDMCTVAHNSRKVDFTSTGGTSGMPLNFYIGSNRSAIEFPYIVTGWKRAGYKLGQSLAVFRGRVVKESIERIRYEHDPILNYHYYSNFHMSEDSVKAYLNHINNIGPCYLHVYPSSAYALARFITNLDIEVPNNIKGILAESENIYDEQRDEIENVFNARMFSSYGHTEKLVAAVECEYSKNYHVWPTYGYFELVDENGNDVNESGKCGEIVGTGFINEVMPFIRYRTGDYATYVADSCSECKREHIIIRNIRGHRTHEYLVMNDGTKVSWTAMNMHDDTFKNIIRFQFYQEKAGFAKLYVIPSRKLFQYEIDRIKIKLNMKFDQRLDFDIQCVSEIKTSDIGKALYVIQKVS